jgi:hypothetical protein
VYKAQSDVETEFRFEVACSSALMKLTWYSIGSEQLSIFAIGMQGDISYLCCPPIIFGWSFELLGYISRTWAWDTFLSPTLCPNHLALPWPPAL